MKKKYVFSVAAAAIGSAALAVAAAHAAYGFGHHGHHGSGAAKPCVAVMTHDQRMGLKAIFKGAKTNIIADHKSVKAAKEALAAAILSGDTTTALSAPDGPESKLSAAELKLQQDEDAAAVTICGKLSSQQLSAAEGLYKNMLKLRESSHEKAREYFKQARHNAGDPAVSQVPSETQSSPQGVE